MKSKENVEGSTIHRIFNNQWSIILVVSLQSWSSVWYFFITSTMTDLCWEMIKSWQNCRKIDCQPLTKTLTLHGHLHPMQRSVHRHDRQTPHTGALASNKERIVNISSWRPLCEETWRKACKCDLLHPEACPPSRCPQITHRGGHRNKEVLSGT